MDVVILVYFQAFCDLCAKLHGHHSGANNQVQADSRIYEQADANIQEQADANIQEQADTNLQEHSSEKVYTDLYKWWVKQSHCKKFRAMQICFVDYN